jgi:hypothetical protein
MKNKKKWVKILVASLILTLLFTYGAPLVIDGNWGQAYGHLNLSFEGISRGLDPKGNAFDINEIKSEEVLAATIKELEWQEKYTTDELRPVISIRPVVSNQALEQLTALVEVEGKTEKVLQNRLNTGHYVILVKTGKVLSMQESKDMLNVLLGQYQIYLKNRYLSEMAVAPGYTRDEVLALDYTEMMLVLGQEGDSLVRYISSFMRSAPDYVSPDLNLSFSDLLAQARLVRDTDIGNAEALVRYAMLTKDAEDRIALENVRLKRMDLNMVKANGAAGSVSTVLAVYNNETNYLITPDILMNQSLKAEENQYYADLLDQQVETKNRAIDLRYNRQEIEKNIRKLTTPDIGLEQYTRYAAEVVTTAEKAYARMDTLKEQALLLANENYDKNIGSKIVTRNIGYQLNSWGNTLLNFLLIFVGIAILSLLWERRKELAGRVSRNKKGRSETV